MRMRCAVSYPWPALSRDQPLGLLLLAVCGVVTLLATHAFAQDVLKVATFNLYRPGLSASTPDSRNNVLSHFGSTLLSQADVAFVQEDGYNSWTEALSQASGLRYFTKEVIPDQYQADVAILSRYPLTNIIMQRGEETGFWLEARAMIGGREHLLITSHFPLKGTSDAEAPNRDLYARQAISRAIKGAVSGYQGESFVGGDLNALESTIAVRMLSESLWDSYVQAPSASRCIVGAEGERIDYIFFRAHYVVDHYDGCQDSKPGDHRLVLVTYHFDPAAAIGPTPPSTECSDNCEAEEQLCMQNARTGPERGFCGRRGLMCMQACGKR